MEAEPVLLTAHLSITGYESELVGIRDLTYQHRTPTDFSLPL